MHACRTQSSTAQIIPHMLGSVAALRLRRGAKFSHKVYSIKALHNMHRRLCITLSIDLIYSIMHTFSWDIAYEKRMRKHSKLP